MADRKLIVKFPEAYRQGNGLKEHSLEDFPVPLTKTFFNLPIYDNPIGIEIEAESYNGDNDDLYFWRTEEDGSLKKAGVEFISMPLVRRMIDAALMEAEEFTAKRSFGHRTSIHIHCNVSHYTMYQLHVLQAFYGLLEKLYFSLVDPIREGNSFCYPIIGTPPTVEWYNGGGENERTTKYCAFNIAPIRKQMSVEFRHCQGTKDFKDIRRWVQICAKLVYYCGKLDPKTCIPFAKEVISNRTFETTVVREIWGDTTDIFNPRQIQESVRNGEFWALAVLSGAE